MSGLHNDIMYAITFIVYKVMEMNEWVICVFEHYLKHYCQDYMSYRCNNMSAIVRCLWFRLVCSLTSPILWPPQDSV